MATPKPPIRRRKPTGFRKPGGRPERGAPPKPEITIQKPNHGELRVLIFGGVSEIGKNMYAIEYNNTIVILECGTMFGESTTPGVNNVMANIEYLKLRKNDIRAMVLTDASASHTGAVPYMVGTIGNPTVYTRLVTGEVLKNRQKNLRQAKMLPIHAIEENTSVQLTDDVTLTFFGVSDRNPASLGVIVETGAGRVAYTGNMQIEHSKGVVSAREEETFSVFKDKEVLLSLADSVNAERPGFSMSDNDIAKNIVQGMQEAPYRVLLPLFPSQIKRNSLMLEWAVKQLGKRVYVQGAPLLHNIETAREYGLITVPSTSFKSIEEMGDDEDLKKVLIISSGAENEEYEMLERMSQGDYRYTKVLKDDTVLFPSPIIPTNARATQNLKDRLSRLGAIIRSYSTSDVKSSKHAGKDELRWMHQRINPRYFIPVQGYHYMLTAHTHILRDIGVAAESCVIPDNGSIIDIRADGAAIKKQKQRLLTTPISVDGHIPTPIQEMVVQDRKTLAQEGILILVLFIDRKNLVLKKSPDILSRGFIYLRESRDLITRTRVVIKNIAEKTVQELGRVEIEATKKAVQKEAQSFLMNETNKKPIIIPVIFTQ